MGSVKQQRSTKRSDEAQSNAMKRMRLQSGKGAWLRKMKRRLIQFMQGRYGVDQFGRFLFWTTLIFLILSILTRRNGFYVLAFILLIYSYFRMLSRNHVKRSAENQRYLMLTQSVRRKSALWKRGWSQRKTHHIYRCPGCRQKIRVPRGKGRIAITCPKCHKEFIKNS